MSYCGNCLRGLDGISSIQCPCRRGSGEMDRRALDQIITMHRQEPDEDFCSSCFNEWPCSTRLVLDKWGRW